MLDYGNIQHTETTLHFGIHDTCALGQARVQGQLELAAHVAGAASDPAPLPFDADVECPFFKEGSPPLCLDLDAGSRPLTPDAAISPDGRGLEIDVGAPPVTADAARPRDLDAGAADDGPSPHRDLGLMVSDDAWAGDLPSTSATDAVAGPVTGGDDAGCSCTVAGGRRPVGKLVWWVGLPLLGVLRWRRSSSRR